LQILKDWGLPVQEAPVSLASLHEASKSGALKEIFGTGTAAVISPVTDLQTKDGTFKIKVPTEYPIAMRLRNEIMGIQLGTIADRFNWIKSL
jgi:branched-chain amino acid aminotransferase